MTKGSIQQQSAPTEARVPGSSSPGPAGRTDNLLTLRPRALRPTVGPHREGAVYTAIGVVVGFLLGVLQTQFHWLRASPFWSGVMLDFALPALVGGGVGALVAWLKAQRRLQQALITSEGFRRRLMSVERNQALWISLSAVLHDVRNPLHSLALLVETLGQPGADVDVLRAQVLEQLERINTRIRRATRQVTEFSGEIRRRPVSLASVLNEAEDMVEPLAQQSSVSVVFRCPSQLKAVADPRFLVQAIDHLVLNCLQILAEQPPERIRRVSVAAQSEEDGRVVLTVEDTGPGLPEDVRARVFEPLLSASSSAGMGLGLAIAHALASAAGGELRLARTGADGTQFSLRLERA